MKEPISIGEPLTKVLQKGQEAGPSIETEDSGIPLPPRSSSAGIPRRTIRNP
jgi:hypothetical protein